MSSNNNNNTNGEATTNKKVTKKTKSNLEYLGSILGGVVILWVLGVLTLVALGTATLSGVPQAWFATIVVPLVLMAAVQVFGKDVYKMVKGKLK